MIKNLTRTFVVLAVFAAAITASSQPGGGGGAICYDACTTPSPCTSGWGNERSSVFCMSQDWVTYCAEYHMVTYDCNPGGPGDPSIGRQIELDDTYPGFSCDGSNINCY